MSDEAEKRASLLPEGEIVRLNEWSEFVTWLLAVCGIGFGLLLLLTEPSSGSNLNGSLRPVLGAVWLTFGLLVASGARTGLVVNPEGITVRYRFHASSYRWSEIKEFRLPQVGPRKALRIELETGRRLRANGFGASLPADVQTAKEIVAELNRRLDAARSGT